MCNFLGEKIHTKSALVQITGLLMHRPLGVFIRLTNLFVILTSVTWILLVNSVI